MNPLFKKINLFYKLANMSHQEARSILGLPEGATPEDIHQAHKKLVFKHHPDRNPGIDTTPIMSQINVARDVLSKPEGFSTIDMSDIENSRQNISDVEDILNKHQETADDYLDDVRKRREWSDYIAGRISASDLKYKENREMSYGYEIVRANRKAREQAAKARRQEKKKEKK